MDIQSILDSGFRRNDRRETLVSFVTPEKTGVQWVSSQEHFTSFLLRTYQ